MPQQKSHAFDDATTHHFRITVSVTTDVPTSEVHASAVLVGLVEKKNFVAYVTSNGITFMLSFVIIGQGALNMGG